MKRWFLAFLTASIFLTSPIAASADVSGLVPCKILPFLKNVLMEVLKNLQQD
jgi:hypothetical protein